MTEERKRAISQEKNVPASRRVMRFLLSWIPDKVAYILLFELRRKAASYLHRDIQAVGKNVVIESDVVIRNPDRLSIGDNCVLNSYVHILARAGVVLEEGVWVASHASIVSHSHPSDVEFIGDHAPLTEPIHIEKHVWIGTHAVILPGVRLGRSCIVAAGAVVTGDVPPYAIVAGVPARVLRYKRIDGASDDADRSQAV